MPIDLTDTLQTVLHQLEAAKDRVERQIMSVRDALDGVGERNAARPERGRRRMSASERQAVSRRMKAYWAQRRATAGANRASTGQPAKGTKTMARHPAGKRRRRMKAAARRAIGRRMKAYWAKRRAQAQRAAGAKANENSSSTKTRASRRRRSTRRTASRHPGKSRKAA